MPPRRKKNTRRDPSKERASELRRRTKVLKQRNPTLGAQGKAYRSILNKHIQPGEHVLELGAGMGWLGEKIVPDELKKNWIESDVAIEFLKRSGGKNKVGASALSLPFKKASMDVIVASSVLGLVPPEAHKIILKEAHRVLKPGGRLIHFQDSVPKIYANEQIKRNSGTLMLKPGNIRSSLARAHSRFSKSLSQGLEEHGFEVRFNNFLSVHGLFPQESRHRDFSELITQIHEDERAKFINAPAHSFINGLYAPVYPEPGTISPGMKGELFTGSALVAMKPKKRE